MLTAGIVVKQADADADSFIVSTALALASSSKPVVVVSADTDIFVMLLTQVVLNMDLHMLCQKNPPMLYNIRDIQDNIGDTCTYLMVIHAISGCDIVSAVYRQGTHKAFNLVHKKHESDMLKIFSSPASTRDEIQKAGKTFLLKLYGAPNHCTSLDAYRYIEYKQAISRITLSSSFQLAALPPTSAAAKQHSYRTYLAVQEWTGNCLQPTESGWKLENNMLSPVERENPTAPDTLLNIISCGCKADGCGATCGCRKMGVRVAKHAITLHQLNQCWM